MRTRRTAQSLMIFAASVVLATDAYAASLRPSVIVHGDTVHLSDIFDGAGVKGDTPLFRAPPPGQSVVLPERWLRQVARTYELDWRPRPGLSESHLRRSSNRVSADAIVEALTGAIRNRMPADSRFEVTLDNADQAIHLPVHQPATVAVRDVFYDAQSKRYSATIHAPDDRPGATALRVAGYVHDLVEVPVLNRRLRPGEIIREKDLDTHVLRARHLVRNAVTSPEPIVGKSARRPLQEGKPLTHSDVREPQMVRRGGMVIMTYQSANMTVTAHGTSRENGTTGDTVRIRNNNSGKIVEAVVTGPDSVAVMPLTQPRKR
ncbi:MAG: flagellar basal body P-ring formation chaperone FlgA [Pseudomonadota bacterium]